MNHSTDWKPDLYLKYGNERTQPSIDLVNRIKIDFVPEQIIDFGCGPGNSSQVLLQRWPSSTLVGVDNSPNMIEKAKQDYPSQEWILADAVTFEPVKKYDVVFSNATIQWISNHAGLLCKFQSILSHNGVLAIQIPLFLEMPVAKAIENVAKSERWKAQTEGVSMLFTIHDKFFYYEHLSDLFTSIEMWETDYIHILDSQFSILEMVKSTGLRPYLQRLQNDSVSQEFENEVLDEIIKYYPSQKNGKVLFPFKRLFFIGYK